MDDAVLTRVTAIVSHHLDVDQSMVTPEASLVDDLAADSLDIIDLVRAFEREFAFDIPATDYHNLFTVRDASSYIDMRLGGE